MELHNCIESNSILQKINLNCNHLTEVILYKYMAFTFFPMYQTKLVGRLHLAISRKNEFWNSPSLLTVHFDQKLPNKQFQAEDQEGAGGSLLFPPFHAHYNTCSQQQHSSELAPNPSIGLRKNRGKKCDLRVDPGVTLSRVIS